MKYQSLNKEETDAVIIQIVDKLLDPFLPFSGEHRRKQWEKGWAENLKAGDIKPKYFDKYPITRFNGEFVKGQDEQQSLHGIVEELALKYFNTPTPLCEFGCGTGHNLQKIHSLFPTIKLIGLDWAKSSNDLVNKLGFKGVKFDYFNPKFQMPECSKVLTVVSLEQVGKKYKKFVKYLLQQKPTVVVHIEPIPELLDPTKLIDYLSIKYMEKRKYLSGYLDYLRLLEQRGEIEILEARGSGVGSLFIDGYSIIVWRPL